MRFTVRSAAGAIGVGACCLLLASCGGGGSDAADGGQGTSEYVAELSPSLSRLGTSASQTGKGLLTAARPADLVSLNRSARSQIGLVSELQGEVGQITPPAELERSHRLLRGAMSSHRLYLGHLSRITAGNPDAGLKALPAATRAGKRALDIYRAYYRTAPGELPRTITDAGLVELAGVRIALRAAVAKRAEARAKEQEAAEARARAREAAARPAPAPTPAPSHGPVTGAGVDYDIVDNSGGEGVRYRYSARVSDLVPGNGPREGATVSISCFTAGEFVRSTSYWAVLTNGYYVPATYLRHSYSGPSAGATYC